MTLPTSGPIQMTQVNNELGSVRNNLNDSWVRALANKLSGGISFADLLGKTGRFDGSITSNGSSQIQFAGNVFFGALLNVFTAGGANPILSLASDPTWTGAIVVVNNTTGASARLVKTGTALWQYGAQVPNLVRPSVTDNFTVVPSA